MNKLYTLDDLTGVFIGFPTENDTRQVRIDVSEWIKEFPQGNISIIYSRPNEDTPYIVAETAIENNILTWSITDADVAIEGLGYAVLQMTDGDKIKRSAVFVVRVGKTLGGSISPAPPPPAPSWITTLLNFIKGGTTGQILAKKSDDDYDTEWIDGGSGTATTVQIDGVSITDENIANIRTTGDYNAENNPLVTRQYNGTALQNHNQSTLSHADIRESISYEAITRQEADSNLQEQIDGITSASDVVDVVGTYAELQEYDTQHLGDNDIIKVLQDETKNDAITYYRWNKSDEMWSYVGSQGPFYTKNETDQQILNHHDNEKQDTITELSKLNSDLVHDTNSTNKFVTAQEKQTWNGKQNAISDLDTIRENAELGSTALQSSKVKSSYSTSSGDVYNATYINSIVGNVEAALYEINSGGGVIE